MSDEYHELSLTSSMKTILEIGRQSLRTSSIAQSVMYIMFAYAFILKLLLVTSCYLAYSGYITYALKQWLII